MQPGFNHTNHTKKTRANIGQEGEECVTNWLKQHGYEILVRNFHARCGEIDIIAKKDSVISFVEVKRRCSHYFSLSEVITRSKQRKIAQTARIFIAQQKSNLLCGYRFDVALIEKGAAIVYVEHAFSLETITW